MEFLEIVIGTDGIKMKEKKVKVVLYWLVPKLVKDVQNSLGLDNYYRKFVKNFAKIARLLYELTRNK